MPPVTKLPPTILPMALSVPVTLTLGPMILAVAEKMAALMFKPVMLPVVDNMPPVSKLPPVMLPVTLIKGEMRLVVTFTLALVTLPTTLTPVLSTVSRTLLTLSVPSVKNLMTLAAVCVPITRLPPLTYR